MAAPSQIYFYRNNIDLLKLADLTGATIKMALVSSAYTPSDGQTGHTVYADLTNELANANGYLTGGATLASPTVAAFSTTGFKFSTGNASWTASGGSIPAWRYGVIYVSGSLWGLSSPLLGYFIGDSAPADIPATSVGQSIDIACPADGWFNVARV